ncbi:Glycosyltransferase involved in cell wall bisynthesis [bacterium A37T11]|nr:Glycosyltransferase involved in cell wall bisynthesis [bacterium A37T11]
MHKVSVIIPNYNHANYLRKRIDSVLTQTYQDFELIILDDYSSDNSREIIESYRNHPKVTHVVYNNSNSGSTFKQWHKGIDLASGKYIWIAESDDWCEPTFLEWLIKPLEEQKDCSISFCQSYCVEENNNIKWYSQHKKLNEVIDGKLFIRKHMLSGNGIFNASMALWRKETFRSISKDFLGFRFCGDWLFWIRLASMGRVAINGRVLNYFRKHKNDVSGKAYSTGFNYVEEMNVINTIYNEHLIGDSEYKRLFKQKFKEFWMKRKNFNKGIKNEVMQLFRIPVSPKVNYRKVFLFSVLWHELKYS